MAVLSVSNVGRFCRGWSYQSFFVPETSVLRGFWTFTYSPPRNPQAVPLISAVHHALMASEVGAWRALRRRKGGSLKEWSPYRGNVSSPSILCPFFSPGKSFSPLHVFPLPGRRPGKPRPIRRRLPQSGRDILITPPDYPSSPDFGLSLPSKIHDVELGEFP